MDFKEALEGVLVKTLNRTSEDVSALYDAEGNLKDDALDTVLGWQTANVAAQKKREKEMREEHYGRGRKEYAAKAEGILKEAGIEGIDLSSDGASDMIRDFIAKKAAPSDLAEDKVKTHPLYLKLERENDTKIKAKDKEWTDKWAERDAKEQRDRILSEVKSKAKLILDEQKPNLPEDPKKKEKLVGVFLSEFDGLSYEMDGDELLIKDKDGKRLENANGHPVKLEDLVKEKSNEYFEFQVSEQKRNLGDPTKGTVNKGAFKLAKPANREELAKMRHEIATSGRSFADRKAANEELDELAKGIA